MAEARERKMSMVCELLQVDAEAIQGLLEHPEQISNFCEQHWLNRKEPITNDLREADLCLDKCYAFLHMTLIEWEERDIWPYQFLQEGGTCIREVEMGNAPGRAFSPQQLEEIAQMLEQITKSEVEASYMGNHGTDDGFESMFELFNQLKVFITRSAKAGKSILLIIN
jgi:hypothetical protein